MTRIYLVQHGDKLREADDPGLTDFLGGLVGRPRPIAAVSHGGATTDLLRTVLRGDVLPPHLLNGGVPACAITTLDDLDVIDIASTAHLS